MAEVKQETRLEQIHRCVAWIERNQCADAVGQIAPCDVTQPMIWLDKVEHLRRFFPGADAKVTTRSGTSYYEVLAEGIRFFAVEHHWEGEKQETMKL